MWNLKKKLKFGKTNGKMLFLFGIIFVFLLLINLVNASIYSQWHLNESSGIIVSDSSGNNRNGTIINNPIWIVGKLNNSLQFNGVNQSVNFGNIAQFNRTDKFSFAFWFYTTSSASSMAFMGNFNTSTNKGIWIHSSGSNKLQLNIMGTGSLTVTCNNTYSLSNWHFAVITYDGTSLDTGVKIYIDNVLQATTTSSNTLNGSSISFANFLFGARSDDYYWNGKLDEVSIYDNVLNISDVSYLYNNGTGTEGIISTIPITINITYPQNITYNINVSLLNYSVSGTNPSKCWYSINNGITNSSFVNASINFVNVLSNEGSNNWNVYCNNTSGNQSSSSITFLRNTTPSSLIIYSPITNWYMGNILINYSASISPANFTVNYYNITLLNLNLTYNQTIISNNSNNLGYIYNSSLADDGFYIIKVTACDINNLCSDGFSQYFLIDNTYPYGDLIDPTNNSFYSNPIINFTINASDNVALGNITLNIRYPNGTLIHQETINTNETSGIFGIVYNFLSNGIYEWFYTIYDSAGNFFQSVMRILNIISVPTVSISYPINDSNYNYTITHLDYSISNGDFCWYSLNNGITNISSGCGTNSIIGLISDNGINIWNVYANNSIGNETSAQVIFNSTCVSPIPVLTLVSYPYVDLNTSYQIKVSSFNVGVSNIKLQMIDPNGSISIYNMIYDNISSYVLTFNFDIIGNYNFVIYGDNICPTIVTNITGTLLVRQPYYITVCGFNDKTGTPYKNNFAYLTAEYTNPRYNSDLDQFITPLGFATTFKTSVFHTSYVNGCGTLKLYEPNATYTLRLFDGQVTFSSEYSIPNMTKSYGTNVAIGQNKFNGTSENLSVYLSAKDLNPYFWLFNYILIFLIIAVIIISIFMFFMLKDSPSFVLIFFIMGIVGLLILRLIIYFWIG